MREIRNKGLQRWIIAVEAPNIGYLNFLNIKIKVNSMWFCFWLWEDIANYCNPLTSSVSQLSRTAAWLVGVPSWLLQLFVPTSSERCCQGVWQQWICHFSSIWYFSLVPSLSEWYPRVAKGRKTWESSQDLPLLWTCHPLFHSPPTKSTHLYGW